MNDLSNSTPIKITAAERKKLSHFSMRVRQRLWPIIGKVDESSLFDFIQDAIYKKSPVATYVTRISRDGKRIWKIEFMGTYFFALVSQKDENSRVFPVTVFTQGASVTREGKSSITLR